MVLLEAPGYEFSPQPNIIECCQDRSPQAGISLRSAQSAGICWSYPRYSHLHQLTCHLIHFVLCLQIIDCLHDIHDIRQSQSKF
jgi:hypothetical protein